jgi:hypothetical protein
MPDDEYADIREREKRLAKVKKDLRTYVEGILEESSMLKGDDIQYYYKIVECSQQLLVGGSVFEENIELPEAERRIRSVVRPTLTAALQMQTKHGGWVHKLWYMYPATIKPIHEYVTEWFGEQTAYEALRADWLYRLYQMCEYRGPGAYALVGLPSFKLACFPVYLLVADVHKNPETHLQRVLEAMWYLQAAGERFEALLTPETRAAAAKINELLHAVLSDIDNLVNILEQTRSAPAVASELAAPETAVPEHERWTSALGEPPIPKSTHDRRAPLQVKLAALKTLAASL